MRKNPTITGGVLLLAILFITGCKREVKDLQSTCRLTTWQGLDDGYLRSLQYNDKGLLSVWREAAPLFDENIYFSVDYGKHNDVTTIKYYDHDVLAYIANPVYNNGRITKELWYNADNSPYDTVENIYNSIGRIVKRHSIPYQYYAGFQYDVIGNTTQILIKGDDGTLYDSSVMQFNKPVREPMQAAPGMPYPIPFINYIISQLKYSADFEYTAYSDGSVQETYEQDDNSVLQAGPQDYAVFYDTFDQVSGVENRQVWKYDNCNCDIDITKQNAAAGGSSRTMSLNKKSSPYIMVPEMTKKIVSLRQQKLKSK